MSNKHHHPKPRKHKHLKPQIRGTLFGNDGRSADWCYASTDRIEIDLQLTRFTLLSTVTGWCSSAESARHVCSRWSEFGEIDSSFHETSRTSKRMDVKI